MGFRRRWPHTGTMTNGHDLDPRHTPDKAPRPSRQGVHQDCRSCVSELSLLRNADVAPFSRVNSRR